MDLRLFKLCAKHSGNQKMARSTFSLKIVIILGLLSGLAPFCTDLYLPALPAIEQQFNEDVFLFGFTFSSTMLVNLTLAASMFGIAWGQILMGYYSDVYGRKPVLFVSLIGFIAFSILCAWSESILMLVLWRFLQGIFAAGSIVVSRAMGFDMFKGPELLRFMATLTLVFGLAPVVSPLFGAFFLEVLASHWRWLFVFLADLGILLFLLSFLLHETLPKESCAPSGLGHFVAQFFALFANKTFVRFLLINSFAFAMLFAYISASSFVFQNIYALDKTQYSYIFAINALGVMAVASSIAKLSNRFSTRAILRVGLLLCVCGAAGIICAVLLMPSSLLILELPLFVVIAGFGAVASTSVAEGLSAISGSGGVASGFFGVVNFTFAGAVSPLVGIMGEKSALPMALLMFVCSFFALLLFLRAQKA